MRDRLTVAQFHYFICQQPQRPASMPFGRFAAGQSRNQGSLPAIYEGGTTGSAFILETLQSILLIVVNELSHGRIRQSQYPAYFFDGFTFIQLQQGSDPLEDFTS